MLNLKWPRNASAEVSSLYELIDNASFIQVIMRAITYKTYYRSTRLEHRTHSRTRASKKKSKSIEIYGITFA